MLLEASKGGGEVVGRGWASGASSLTSLLLQLPKRVMIRDRRYETTGNEDG